MKNAPPRTHRPSWGGLLPIVVVAALRGGAAHAADRVKMVVTSRETGVQDRVRRATQAVCEEDLKGLLGCFTAKERSRIRRRTALLFVTHTLKLVIVDSHVPGEAQGRAELAGNYSVRLTDQAYGVVSILDLTAEEGRWLIAGEHVQAVSLTPRDDLSTSSGRVFRFGGGRRGPGGGPGRFSAPRHRSHAGARICHRPRRHVGGWNQRQRHGAPTMSQ